MAGCLLTAQWRTQILHFVRSEWGQLANAVLGEGDIDFSYINHALSIRKLYIPVGEGILAAQGGMSSNGDFDIQRPPAIWTFLGYPG